MVSLFGLITLFLRLALSIQSQVVEILPVDHSINHECFSQASPEGVIYSSEGIFSHNISLVRKLENEEKHEQDGGNLLFYVDFFNFRFIENASTAGSNPIYGNKALRGSLPPLYDLFHSWKIYLS